MIVLLSVASAQEPEPDLAIGKSVPSFTEDDVTGTELTSAGLNGQNAVYVFVSPDDAASVRHLRALVKASATRPGLIVVVFSTALRQNPNGIKIAARALYDDVVKQAEHVRVVVVNDELLESFGRLVQSEPLRDVPATFFADTTGVVRAVEIGELTEAEFATTYAASLSSPADDAETASTDDDGATSSDD